MTLTPIEQTLVALLQTNGPIRGTSQVGYALWPDRDMQPQGAAAAASNVLHRLKIKGYVTSMVVDGLPAYSATDKGISELAAARLAAIDKRQLSIFDADADTADDANRSEPPHRNGR